MPSPTELEREQHLFSEAFALEDATARSAFLAKACGDDVALRARVERLLEMSAMADAWFGEDAFTPDEREGVDHAEECLTRIGRYRLLERMGTGGHGVVYLAEQLEPVKRQVALKIIRFGTDSDRVVARFAAEQQALAMMEHPYIAQVLDAGTTDTGWPFFVMERVRGEPLSPYCDRRRLSLAARLELFCKVCRAIQHAHQKGILHRDIKPSNILVTEIDGQPVPKVIDFGIARAIHVTDRGDKGPMIGSPDYMSPEQAIDGGAGADTRGDVYSLGVVLCELLTGALPHPPVDWASLEPERLCLAVAERTARAPSALLADASPADQEAIADARAIRYRVLQRRLADDLDCIVLRALAARPDERYATAAGLADDLQRVLAGQVPEAHPGGRLYHVRKFVARHRMPVAVAAFALGSLALALGVTLHLYASERRAVAQQIVLRQEAWAARANESRLREQAEAGERMARAAVKIAYGKTAEAQALIEGLPLADIQPSLEASLVFRTLGTWHAEAGRWPEAADYFSALTYSLTTIDENDTYAVSGQVLPAASAILMLGDDVRYDAYRRQLIARFGTTGDPLVAEQIIKACLLRPATPEMLTGLAAPFEVIERIEANPLPHANETLAAWRTFSLGLMEFRRGNLPEAARWIRRCLSSSDLNEARVCGAEAVLAMIAAREGDFARAQAHLDTARALWRAYAGSERTPAGAPLRGNWYDWLNGHLLIEEASGMMRITPSR